MRLCDLRQKEIINICTCKSLGCPIDLMFHPKTGQLEAIIVALPGRFCGFFMKENECIIPWECIRQIGEDIILVELREQKLPPKRD